MPFTSLRPNLLALAITLGSSLSPYALAEGAHHFDIPAAPLGETLSRIARDTGHVLSVSPELLRDKQAPAIRGEMTEQQAVEQALQGSGLRLGVTPGGTWNLYPAAESGALELGATTVGAVLLGATTEGTGSYTTGVTSTATRLGLSLRETPQSVSVVTRQQMDDQNMQSLEDVAKAATGITTSKGYGTERPLYFSRGFQVSDLQFDGVPSSISEDFSMDVLSGNNMAIYDRVEIVRGANGLLQGAGNPSAAINLVRKRPTDSYKLKAEVSAGSWDNYRTQVDVGGPLNEQGTLRGRTVVLYNSGNSYVDRAEKDNQLFYAIGEADLSDATTISLGAVLQRDYHDGYDWGGLPTRNNGSFYPFSRSTSMAADWTHLNKLNRTLFADVRHQLNDDWKLTVNASTTWSNADFLAFYGYHQSGDDMLLYTNDTKYDQAQSSLDATLNGNFEWLGRKHDLVFGASARRDRLINESRYNSNTITVDIPTYDPGAVPAPVYAYERMAYRNKRKDKGLYGAVRLNPLDDLHLIAGSRVSWVDYQSKGPDSGDRFTENAKLIPYAGVVYDLSELTSLYASYTEIYKLQSNYDISNKLLQPMTGSNYEVGMKNEFLDGRLNTAIALFQVDLAHMPDEVVGAPRICGPGRSSRCYEEGGKVRNRGFDVEVSGEILSGWNGVLGYTYSHPEYVTGTKKGTIYATETGPQRLFKLASTYQLPGALQDWRVGGNVYHQSRIYRGMVEQGAYNLVDFNAHYTVSDNLSVQLNLNNAFDKKYYSSIYDTSGGNYMGAPRNFAITLRYEN